MDIEIIRNICAYIKNNINENITIEEIEKLIGYNKYYIMRAFKEYTGYTITEYINTSRAYSTIKKLITTDDSILKIALNHGFNSLEYYSEIFKKTIGTSPKKFQKLASCKEKEELIRLKEYLKELENNYNYILGLPDTALELKQKPKTKARTIHN